VAKAIVLREPGGPEVLRYEEFEVGSPAAGQVRLRHTAIGVNFHDTYVRSGSYQTLPLPGVPGLEAVGVIDTVGSDVVGFQPGDRVGYIDQGYGAYATERLIAADRLVRFPAVIDDRIGAASLIKVLTAGMLLHRLRPLAAGETILVHAAAGAVGRLTTQWAHTMGLKVIGTVGSDAKAEIARANGCDEAIVYSREDVVERVRQITGGRGVDVAYDSVGADTFDGSLESLARLGWLVNFGQSSGPVPPLAMSRLQAKSNTVVRPMLFDYMFTPTERDALVDLSFGMLASGKITVEIGGEFALADAADAHRALESRGTSGSIILIP
jgi:NADPH2:quinone reductase